MALEGWYYLHTNGDIIYKRELGGTRADLADSDFVRSVWPFDPADRKGAWDIVVEATALGARAERIAALAEHWGCDDVDAENYAAHLNARIFRDGDRWCATRADFTNIQDSPVGFGVTSIQALGALCKALGFTGRRTWSATFWDLLRAPRPAP